MRDIKRNIFIKFRYKKSHFFSVEKKRIKTLQEDILKEELTDFIINCIIKINLHKKIKYAIVFMVKLEID